MTAAQPKSLAIRRIDARQAGFQIQLQQLRAQLSPSGNIVSPKGRELTLKVFGEPLSPVEVVERICEAVRMRGLDAVLEYGRKLDGYELNAQNIRIPEVQLHNAHSQATPDFLATIRRIRQNIVSFQQAILHQDIEASSQPGIRLTQRYVPLRRIGVCVPGGAAAYPSTVLMTVVPAQVAGVDEIAIVAPPTQFGAFNPDVLATCYELGVREVYPLGGAQAVAAMAYGVQGLPAVDKIVGPGNLFVAMAKKHLYGTVDIDSIAGPSEVVVLADSTTNPKFAAADLLAQAEHSPGASILITWDSSILESIEQQLVEQMSKLTRSELIIDSLNEFGAFIVVRDSHQACEVTDLLAPEHLHIACEQPRSLCEKIRNAGATFIGPYSPVALGDYAAGPSHVLPTGGTARWAAGLSANSFLRSNSVIEYSEASFSEIAPHISLLAEKECLTAHRQSVQLRFGER